MSLIYKCGHICTFLKSSRGLRLCFVSHMGIQTWTFAHMKAALQALPDSTVTCCLAPPPVRRGYVRIDYTNYPCWTESDNEEKKQVKCPFQSCVLLALLVSVECFVTPTCFLFCLHISFVSEPPLCASLTPLLQRHCVGWICAFSVGFSNNRGPFLCTVVLIFRSMSEARGPSC